jgi:Protein of unknown function (DUF3152)
VTRSSQSGQGATERSSPTARDTGGPRSGGREQADRRYVRGERRTSAEPLTASWDPEALSDADLDDEDLEPPPRGWRRFIDTYGWRVYAVPVLVVLTVLVIFEGTRGSDSQAGGDGSGPVVTEHPAGGQDLDVPTAELPTGGDYTKVGKNTWHIVPGSSQKVGHGGKLYTYTVEIENGIEPSEYGGDDAFAKLVDDTLADPRSWTGDGRISVRRVGQGGPKPDFRISLTTPGTDHRRELCGYGIKYESSCYRQSAGRVIINLARWVRGAKAFGADMYGYRQYAINHEVGHAFGNGHVGCPRNGAPAPVMMQQSFGVSNDYVARLNRVDSYNRQAVSKDHKTCMPNAWPNPVGTPVGGGR